jgi:hypothetical protein
MDPDLNADFCQTRQIASYPPQKLKTTFEELNNLILTGEEKMSQTIVKNRMGRVLLHTLCALRDHQWNWHWRGIVREFSKC